MIVVRLIEKLTELMKELGEDTYVIVRGFDVVADISDVYVDSDHGNEKAFISIDLEED